MPSAEKLDHNSIRLKVVDSLHLVLCILGSISLSIGWVRAHLIQVYTPNIAGTIAMGFLVVGYFFRKRIPWQTRSGIILLGLILTAGNALWNYGLVAPAGCLLPTMVVLGWLLWPRNSAIALTLFSLLVFVVAAFQNIQHGSVLDPHQVSFNRAPIFWINMGFVYTAVGGVVSTVLLVLFGSYRQAMERAQAGERASRLDKERLSGILSGIHDAIFLLDPKGGGSWSCTDASKACTASCRGRFSRWVSERFRRGFRLGRSRKSAGGSDVA